MNQAERRKGLLLALLCLIALSGCRVKDMNYIIENEPSIKGVVEEKRDGYVLMRNDDGEYIVSLNVKNKDGSPGDLVIGDEIVVYYYDGINETDPMQVDNVYTITLNALSEEKIAIDTFEGNVKTYYEMRDGYWMCDDYEYRYRLEISGRMPNAVKDSTFVYLSNIEEIPFERAYLAAGLSSNTDDYFSPEEAVLVEMH